MTEARTYDMAVLGSGPAGQKAAVQAAKLGKRVAVVERKEVVGGVCVNTGTIPSKTLREAVLNLSGLRERAFYGDAYRGRPLATVEDLFRRCHIVISREIDVIRNQLHRNGVDMIAGAGTFEDPHALKVVSASNDVTRVNGEFIVIATGTRPAFPAGVKLDGETLLTSDDVLGLKALPRTLTVVGGGVIGIEYASMFAVLGCEVTVVDLRQNLLEFIDREILDDLIYQLRAMNCTFRLGERVSHVELNDEGKKGAVTHLESGKRLVSDKVLFSAGRVGSTGDLNLAAAGLAANAKGRLDVDEHFRTGAPHIFAVGDVVGFPALASTAMEQGRLAALYAFGHADAHMSRNLPIGIYSIPELSMIGRTEADLTEAKIPYEFGVARYKEIARGQILGDYTGLLKILFHRETRHVLGVHAIGTQATELIHIGQAVMELGGTIDYFVKTVFNYPTFAECYKVAALDGINKLNA